MDSDDSQPLPKNRSGRTKLSLRRKKDIQPPDTQLDPSSPSKQNLPTCTTSLDKLPGFRLVLRHCTPVNSPCTPVNSPTKEGKNEGTSSSQGTAPVDAQKIRLDLQSVAAVLEEHRSPKQGSSGDDDVKESVAGGIEISACRQTTLLSPAVLMEEHSSSSKYEVLSFVEQADYGLGDMKSALNIPVGGALYESSDGASDGFGELFFCQLCQKDLTRFSIAQRQQHINRCCDERGKLGGEPESEVAGCHVCVLCKKVFKANQPLLAHMKGCAKKRGVSTTQLLGMKREAEACGSPGSREAPEEAVRSKKPRVLGSPPKDTDGDFQVPPPPDRPKRGRKRKQEGQPGYLESLEDEQLQLALAMSASLDPLTAAAEVYPNESGEARRKRRRRGRRVAIGNEDPPLLLLTSSSQAEGMVARRAEQILTKLPSAEGGDGSDDEIPCTPAFAASELGHNPVLPERHRPVLKEEELLLGEGNAEMGKAKPVSDTVAIPTSSSDDEDLDDNVLKSSNRTLLMELECGVVAGSLANISKDDMRWKQPTGDLAEVIMTGISVGKNAVPLSEGEAVTASDETSPRLREQTSKCLAALGGGDTAGLSYSTLWQLSNYQEHEDSANFYVPALASIISPVKAAPLCGICCSDPCVAVLHRQVSCKFSDVTITSQVPLREEAKSSEHVTPVACTKTGIARLTSDLHSLIGSSLLSDVTITTRNGSKVPAHAALLACRCPALREVLAPPSSPGTPHCTDLDLSDFDDEVVFACLEYLYTGSSPLLQKEGRSSSRLLQEVGQGSEEGLLQRFTLLAQRLSLEEFAHLFPSNAYCNSDGDTPCPNMEVEQVKPTCEPVADLSSPIGPTIVGEKGESVSLDPDECSSNSDSIDLQFHCLENEQDTNLLVDITSELPDNKKLLLPSIESPKESRRGLSGLKDTTDGETSNSGREPDTQNMPQDCSNSMVVEVTDIKTTSQTLPCEGIQDSTAAATRDCNVVYVSSSPEEGSRKSPRGMLDGITSSDVVGSAVTMEVVAGTSPLKLPTLSRELDKQRETDASSDYSVELCANNDSLLLAVDETLVWNHAGPSPDCRGSTNQLTNKPDKEGLRTDVQFATPRPIFTATTILEPASTTPILFATPTDSTGAVSVGDTLLPVKETLGAIPAMSVGGCSISPVQLYMTPAPSSVCVDLESDDNITPMPDYRTMKTPMLKGECSRFGVRALPKKKMIAKLEEIYDYTHPLVDADGNVVSAPEIDPPERPKATGGPSKRGKPPAKRRVGKHKPRSQDEITAGTQADGDLSRQVQECIVSNRDLYQDMLLYQPLELSHIQTQLKSGGTNISKEKLLDMLDHWCVTYSLPRASQAQKTNRKTKQRCAL